MTRFLVQGINPKTGGIDPIGIVSLPSEVRELLLNIPTPYELYAIEEPETGRTWNKSTLSTFYPSEKK